MTPKPLCAHSGEAGTHPSLSEQRRAMPQRKEKVTARNHLDAIEMKEDEGTKANVHSQRAHVRRLELHRKQHERAFEERQSARDAAESVLHSALDDFEDRRPQLGFRKAGVDGRDAVRQVFELFERGLRRVVVVFGGRAQEALERLRRRGESR